MSSITVTSYMAAQSLGLEQNFLLEGLVGFV